MWFVENSLLKFIVEKTFPQLSVFHPLPRSSGALTPHVDSRWVSVAHLLVASQFFTQVLKLHSIGHSPSSKNHFQCIPCHCLLVPKPASHHAVEVFQNMALNDASGPSELFSLRTWPANSAGPLVP